MTNTFRNWQSVLGQLANAYECHQRVIAHEQGYVQGQGHGEGLATAEDSGVGGPGTGLGTGSGTGAGAALSHWGDRAAAHAAASSRAAAPPREPPLRFSWVLRARPDLKCGKLL